MSPQASRVDVRGRLARAGVALLVVGATSGLVACSAVEAGPRTVSESTAPGSTAPASQAPVDYAARAQRAQRSLNALTDAARSGDEAAAAAVTSTRDPGFAGELRRFTGNVGALESIAWTMTQRTSELPAQRRTALGADAWVGLAEVTWSVPGDGGHARHRVWVTFVPQGDSELVAGFGDGVSETRPLWLLEPITVHTSGRATVVAGSRIDPQPWLDNTARAAGNVTAARLGAADEGWNHRLVVIVPSNQRMLEQMLRLGRDEYAGIAAVTVPDGGNDHDSRALRIVVNPGADMDTDVARVVLTHEAVHVATDAAHSGAPLWLVEGLADLVANDTYRWAADTQQDEARPSLRRKIPTGLPRQKDFEASAGDLAVTYLRSWLAVRQIRIQHGSATLLSRYAEADAGSALDIDTSALAHRVEADLRSIAAGDLVS